GELEGKSWKADHVDTAGWTLSKGADKRYLGWPETPEALLWTLSGKLEPSISNDAGLTILLAFGNRLESASRAVYASVARDPANSEKAQAFLAHLLGISVPQGGFAVLGGRYVTPETIEAIETQRKVDALVATFTKGLGKRETLAMRKKSDAAFDELLTLGELAIKPTVDVLTGARALAFEKIEKSTGLASRDSDTLK